MCQIHLSEMVFFVTLIKMDLFWNSDLTIWEVAAFLSPKVFFSLLCGGLIGLERELKQKAAGLKTLMLICLGAALYTSLSVIVAATFANEGFWGDPARIAAQIVPGIGFLGAGAIIQSRGNVLGLTTAATIWVVAAIGVIVGFGNEFLALGISVIVVAVLVAITYFEGKFLGRAKVYHCDIIAEDPDGEARTMITDSLEQNDLKFEDFNLSTKGKLSTIRIRYIGSESGHKKFLHELWSSSRVKEVSHH